MRRLASACGASLVLYVVAFACVLDRPLGLGPFRMQIESQLVRGAALGPKLVIFAGSNGPYSHRCEIMETLVGRMCINAGVAVGIGLDYLFARWKPLLRPGDWAYLPLEDAQYVRSRSAAALGPDAAIMARHDRATLRLLPFDRQLGAVFSSDLRAAMLAMLETALVAGRFADPRAGVVGSINAWGDRVGHTPALAAPNAPHLAAATPYRASARDIRSGDGSDVVRGFLIWARRNGVTVVGGLPTCFADTPASEESLAALRSLYESDGAGFATLPNRGGYPRADFFDTPDHLHEQAQIAHSQAIGAMLAALMAPGSSSPRR